MAGWIAAALIGVAGSVPVTAGETADADAASQQPPSRADALQAARVPEPDPILTRNELLSEAVADECFAGIGVEYPPINPDGTCPEGIPKTNESYVWGLTQAGSSLWFGTIANAACVVTGPPPESGGPNDAATPNAEGNYVCEFGDSQLAQRLGLPAGLGDWRPPSIYQYDLIAGRLEQRAVSDLRRLRTLGLRGAGSIGNIAFLSGPNLFNNAINFFAFDGSNGAYLGSCERSDFNYVRGWTLANDVLYVGVGAGNDGGVLRWDGDADSFNGNFCDDFTEVGRLAKGYTAYLSLYRAGDGEDRLAASTFPSNNSSQGVGVWLSPPLGADGLSADDTEEWQQAWSPRSYEPDLIVSRVGYSAGALASYDGWLYWSTLHLPTGKADDVHSSCGFDFCFGDPETPEEAQQLRDGTYRTATVWRGRNLESPLNREIELLYGESELPACTGPGTFEMTATGWTPRYGRSGFDNESTEYIWQMAELDGRLFVGTFDVSAFRGPTEEVGADLWRFDSGDAPAVAEDFEGLGDRLNYGIRTMIPLRDGSGLILGMANPFNLNPGGGWELRRLSPEAP